MYVCVYIYILNFIPIMQDAINKKLRRRKMALAMSTYVSHYLLKKKYICISF